MKKPGSVEEYIESFPKEVQKTLKQMRSAVKKAAPKAEEKISYGMPYYSLNGRLVYFAGYKRHIGFYPMPGAIAAFKKEIAKYKWAKGSVQFLLDKPLPISLITKMIKFRVKENEAKIKLKIKAGG
jgi:uncharacterized protein YdhG (YjbR/CyaY superfamily)